MPTVRKRERDAFRIGDLVSHRKYPKKCGTVMAVGRDYGSVLYTVKWSDHPKGSSRHFPEALKAVIKKL